MNGDIEKATTDVGGNPGEDGGLETKGRKCFKERMSNCVKYATQRSSKMRTKNIRLDIALWRSLMISIRAISAEWCQ